MPTQFFTDDDDSFTVSSAGDYSLVFLGGNDTLTATAGTSIRAAMGEDDDSVLLKAGTPTDTIVWGESGADRFDIWAGGITAYGGEDNDLFNLRAGSSQTLFGDDGNDRFNLLAAIASVSIDGGAGNDDFYGYGHTSSGDIYGGTGNDTFNGFVGTNGIILHGGLGNDVYRADPTSPATFQENVGEGNDTVQVARGSDYMLPDNIENISVQGFIGSDLGPATLTANDLDNRIAAHNNAETIYGLGGNDTIVAAGGDDIVDGGEGNDYLDGGSGNDTLTGGNGNDVLQGRSGDDVMSGGAGDDTYYVDSAGDQVSENADGGTDLVRTSVDYTLGANVENAFVSGPTGLTLTGNDLDNLLAGGTGGDTLLGMGGADTLRGGAGSDIIDGGAGTDTIVGGTGGDTLTGGADSDTFMYFTVDESLPLSSDVITDFQSHDGDFVGDDVLNLSGIDANTAIAGDQAFGFSSTTPTANSMWVVSNTDNGDGTHTFVLGFDVNGDTTADMELTLHATTGNAYFDDIIL